MIEQLPIGTLNFSDDEHIIYYSFLKSNNLGLTSDSRFGLHTSLSRTYEGVCLESQFKTELALLAKNQGCIDAKISSLVYFGDKNTVPALLLDSDELVSLHRRLMSKLLFLGSPYAGKYMYEGCGKLTKDESGCFIQENCYAPHLSLPKDISKKEISALIGTTVTFDSISFAIKNFGYWSDTEEIKF